MKRRVFLSILGTGKYTKTSYYFNDKANACETHFVQEATIRHFCNNWNENDVIIIFLTNDAKTKNWNNPADNGYEGLSKLLEQLSLKSEIKTIDIPDGRNENELWKIFDIIYNALQNNDELYIDITHAFRSLPMLLTVLLNYAKVLKKVNVNAITYGNFEAKDDKNYSPIIDITALSELQDWTIAANNFVEFGNSNMLTQLTNQEINPVLKNTQGKDMTASQLRWFSNNLSKLTNNLSTLRGKKIFNGENINELKKSIEDAANQNALLPQLKPLLNIINEKISAFVDQPDIVNLITATKWFIQHQQYQQAYSILTEGIITHLCQKVSIPIDDIEKRQLVVSAAQIIDKKIPKEWWNENCKNNEEVLVKLFEQFNANQNLLKALVSLSEQRNDFMHAGFRENSADSRSIIEKITNSFEIIEKIIR